MTYVDMIHMSQVNDATLVPHISSYYVHHTVTNQECETVFANKKRIMLRLDST
jgi:hypothetical protein